MPTGLLVPGWTDYSRTILYNTYDITSLLRPGPNTIGMCLAGGMYNVQEGRYVKFVSPFRPLVAFGEIRLEYADRVVSVVTDTHWRTKPGPISFSNFYGGEDYDARQEPAGWDQPGFNDSDWTPAVETPGPGGVLKGIAHSSPAFRTWDEFKPADTRQLRPGAAVYDFGQNAAFIPRLRARGPTGSIVRMIPAELLNPDGSVDRRSVGGGNAWWQYSLKGRGDTEDMASKVLLSRLPLSAGGTLGALGNAPAAGGIDRSGRGSFRLCRGRGIQLFQRAV